MIALSKVNSYSGLSHDGMKQTIYDHGDDKDNCHDVIDIDNSVNRVPWHCEHLQGAFFRI